MNTRSLLLMLMVILLHTASCSKKENDAEMFRLTTAESSARWKGFLRTGYYNEGSIAVESQNIEVLDGLVKSGTFTMPLSTIKNFNLPTDALKEQLIHHLQSGDFFDMALHPNISFTIENVKHHSDSDPENVEKANFLVNGQLVILGKSEPVSFPARISKTGDQISIAAKIRIDRTKWGITYASDPTLPDDQYILPEIQIELDLKGARK